MANYWLSKGNKKGDDARIIVDLGCEKEIDGFYMRNTHNADKNNRGTKNFTLLNSVTADGPWNILLHGFLPDANNNVEEITIFFPLDKIISTQFVMFQVDTFYGKGGGLHFISENEAGKKGQTYSGNIELPNINRYHSDFQLVK